MVDCRISATDWDTRRLYEFVQGVRRQWSLPAENQREANVICSKRIPTGVGAGYESPNQFLCAFRIWRRNTHIWEDHEVTGIASSGHFASLTWKVCSAIRRSSKGSLMSLSRRLLKRVFAEKHVGTFLLNLITATLEVDAGFCFQVQWNSCQKQGWSSVLGISAVYNRRLSWNGKFREQSLVRFDTLCENCPGELLQQAFYLQFMDVLEKVGKRVPLDELLEIFNNQAYSDYLVVYCRFVCWWIHFTPKQSNDPESQFRLQNPEKNGSLSKQWGALLERLSKTEQTVWLLDESRMIHHQRHCIVQNPCRDTMFTCEKS